MRAVTLGHLSVTVLSLHRRSGTVASAVDQREEGAGLHLKTMDTMFT